jgi:hypothetical protein
MLISPSTIDAGDVATFKLVNGDEIVAKVVEKHDDRVKIERPFVVIPNQQGLGIMPVMFSVDNGKPIELLRQHFMMMALTSDAIKNHYIQTTTGIAI